MRSVVKPYARTHLHACICCMAWPDRTHGLLLNHLSASLHLLHLLLLLLLIHHHCITRERATKKGA